MRGAGRGRTVPFDKERPELGFGHDDGIGVHAQEDNPGPGITRCARSLDSFGFPDRLWKPKRLPVYQGGLFHPGEPNGLELLCKFGLYMNFDRCIHKDLGLAPIQIGGHFNTLSVQVFRDFKVVGRSFRV